MTVCRVMDTPIGRLRCRCDEEGITELHLLCEGEAAEETEQTSDEMEETIRQIAAYFAGERRSFTLRLSIRGTAFERLVWRELERIPYGETRTYGQIAHAIGRPKAARAVGAACGRNPVLIVTPCHRVIGSDGRLTGFAAGLKAKEQLLALEAGHRHEDRMGGDGANIR